jgi:hypothetical protein
VLDNSICHVYLQDMKRSEMLEKMVFSMELHAGNDPAWLDQMPSVKAGAYDYANKILRDLEQSGMLPPTIRIPAFGVTDNAWEPEDE